MARSPYFSRATFQFLKDLKANLDAENLVTSHIENRDGIYESIKTFLSKGV